MACSKNKTCRFIDPLKDLGALLLSVEKPARYTGGEYGRLCRVQSEPVLKTLIAFPDLYEVGMSNQAVRILYNRINAIDEIICDRAFAPAPDFETLLRKKSLPLYGLDTGISLKDLDILMFSFGYELGLTGIFSMMDVSEIPLFSCERGENDPIVIMGGPCVSNPLPYSAFIDAFWIGEAEDAFFNLAEKLLKIKKAGGGRDELFSEIAAHESVWVKGKDIAVRAIDRNFHRGKNEAAVFPVPSMQVIHHHGAVEIMRGCPNGCRFCHAGFWYRPMRQKCSSHVEAETEAFIRKGGYREITLSSLSTGDYENIDSLIDTLNDKYRDENISFKLPSLKVTGFSLDLLEKVSKVRKSGLTFAVETPGDFQQMSINKQVSLENVVSIIKEAKMRGWRQVKFYFMIGLPVKHTCETKGIKISVEEEIVEFIEKASALTRMKFNINIGTFVPKPHTPYQNVPQLSRIDAEQKLNFLRGRLKSLGHKVGIQDPLLSVIEGIASRGDERAGEMFLEAYRNGCRLDSWSEHFKRDLWEELIKKNINMLEEILGGKEAVPWSCISSKVSGNYLSNEMKKSNMGEITSACMDNCNFPCGSCDKSEKMVRNIIQDKANSCHNKAVEPETINKTDPDTHRILFSFTKKGSAIFHSHLGLIEIFSMTFIRADIPVLYTQGFNPLPRLDFASPLSLGVKADGEIASIDTKIFFEAENFKTAMNRFFPEGIEIKKAINVEIKSGQKKHSVSSLLWGFEYKGPDGQIKFIEAKNEKPYRLSQTGEEGSIYDLERYSVLAKSPEKDTNFSYASYFDVYRTIYN